MKARLFLLVFALLGFALPAPAQRALGPVTVTTINGITLGSAAGHPASDFLTGNQTITLSGDASGSGATAITVTIGAGKVTNSMLAGSIDLTSKVAGVLPVANGGTGTATPGLVAGTNITITGSYPNQTINASGGGGSGGDMLATLLSPETSITGATALDATAFGKAFACSDAGSPANYTVALYASTSGDVGKHVQFRMDPSLTKLVTIDAGSGGTIDGQRTRIMWAQETALLRCTGAKTWTKSAGRSRAMIGRMSIAANTPTAQALAATVVAPVAFDNVDADNAGAMCSTSTGRISCLRPGFYAALASEVMNFGVTPTRFILRVRVNAVGFGVGSEVGVGNAGTFPSVSFATGFTLAAGDYVDMTASSTVDGTLYGAGLCWLSVIEQDPW